jgi:uncharacterized lipoprotein YajG
MTRHMRAKWLTLIVAAPLLAGCEQTEPVLMRDPSGRVVQCGPYDNRAMISAAFAFREAQCIQDYKEQGFVRVPAR